MGDFIRTIKLTVEIQENGIIRDEHGEIIGKLVKGVEFGRFVSSPEQRACRDCNGVYCNRWNNIPAKKVCQKDGRDKWEGRID